MSLNKKTFYVVESADGARRFLITPSLIFFEDERTVDQIIAAAHEKFVDAVEVHACYGDWYFTRIPRFVRATIERGLEKLGVKDSELRAVITVYEKQ